MEAARYRFPISKSGNKLPALGRGNEACVGSIENEEHEVLQKAELSAEADAEN
jgi:hypothetical protein